MSLTAEGLRGPGTKKIPALLTRALPAGSRVRVLVVDDSVIIRRVVTHALEQDPRIEVVGVAADGALALQRIAQLNPDVITLDIEMPTMDGLAALRKIRERYPALIVIMLSAQTDRGAAATMEALATGANDYVGKAAHAGSTVRESAESLRAELLPKIWQFFYSDKRPPEPDVPRLIKVPPPPKVHRSVACVRRVVLIGVSTGGPDALSRVMPMFPADFRLPILIVQHMPPIFTRLLAERLTANSSIKVEEATDGCPVEAGKALIAPGDHHMEIRRNAAGEVFAVLNQNPPENSCRPAVDVLFRSAGAVYGGSAIAAILTGMGSDGVRSAAALHEKGAYMIAQDEASSVVWGMPGALVAAGLADSIVDLDSVVPEILKQL